MATPSNGAYISSNANTLVAPCALPRLHYCCFKGDLAGVLSCIIEGSSIHEAVAMKNQKNQIVCGITPLFLAAQQGHRKVCKLLVENGAHPNQPSYIQGSTDLCTPVEVAKVNMHILLARYLKKKVKDRQQEDVVLAQDQQDEDSRRRGQGPPAAKAFMADLADLQDWSPAEGGVARMDAGNVAKLMKRQKMDLYAWNPDSERSSPESAKALPTSHSVVVHDLTELEQVDVNNSGRMLNMFLKDLDVQSWDPQVLDHVPDEVQSAAGRLSEPSQDQRLCSVGGSEEMASAGRLPGHMWGTSSAGDAVGGNSEPGDASFGGASTVVLASSGPAAAPANHSVLRCPASHPIACMGPANVTARRSQEHSRQGASSFSKITSLFSRRSWHGPDTAGGYAGLPVSSSHALGAWHEIELSAWAESDSPPHPATDLDGAVAVEGVGLPISTTAAEVAVAAPPAAAELTDPVTASYIAEEAPKKAPAPPPAPAAATNVSSFRKAASLFSRRSWQGPEEHCQGPWLQVSSRQADGPADDKPVLGASLVPIASAAAAKSGMPPLPCSGPTPADASSFRKIASLFSRRSWHAADGLEAGDVMRPAGSLEVVLEQESEDEAGTQSVTPAKAGLAQAKQPAAQLAESAVLKTPTGALQEPHTAATAVPAVSSSSFPKFVSKFARRSWHGEEAQGQETLRPEIVPGRTMLKAEAAVTHCAAAAGPPAEAFSLRKLASRFSRKSWHGDDPACEGLSMRLSRPQPAHKHGEPADPAAAVMPVPQLPTVRFRAATLSKAAATEAAEVSSLRKLASRFSRKSCPNADFQHAEIPGQQPTQPVPEEGGVSTPSYKPGVAPQSAATTKAGGMSRFRKLLSLFSLKSTPKPTGGAGFGRKSTVF